MEPCNVNSDVLFEIFSRVELKTLRRCRLLSKECNSLTYESSFMRLYCQRTKTAAGFFIQSLKNSRYYSTFVSIDNPGFDSELRLDFLPDRSVEILATVDQGLMFCMSQSENRYYICKPSTRQWEIIPSPNSPSFSFTRKIGMMVLRSDPLRFKIVQLSDGEYKDSELDLDYSEPELDDYKRFHSEIFDSDSWAWKQLDDLMLSYNEFFNSKPAISAYNGLHWLTCNGDKNNILSFNQDKESWELISLPDSLCGREHWYPVNLAEYEGKLALIYMRRDIDSVEVWIMKDYYGEKLWSKRHSVNLTAFNKEVGHSSAVSFYNADTLLMTGWYTAIFYNFKNGQFDRFELPLRHKYPESAYFVQTDYVPVQLRQPRKASSSIVTTPIFIVFLLFILFLICFIRDI